MEIDGDIHDVTRKDRAIPGMLREVPGLRLRIWNVGFKAFDQLAGFPNLAELSILDWTAPTFEPLAGLRALRVLTIIHFPKVGSLAPLAGLVDLEELALETLPSWDGSKHQQVDSLAPLAGLRKLRVLKLAGVFARDADLSPLGQLSELRQLAIANLYPQAQFARLTAKLPRAEAAMLAPFARLRGYGCKKCGGEKVLLSGADVPNPKVVCPVCQKKKFSETVARFEQYRQAV
jgi:hypothetical protein